jgi:hypothetical protein
VAFKSEKRKTNVSGNNVQLTVKKKNVKKKKIAEKIAVIFCLKKGV